MSSLSSRIARDDRGAILVFFIVCLPVLVAAVGFVIDLTRAQTLQTQLQRVADSAALAAAKEMDYRSDGLTRAQSAAFGMLNRPTMAKSASGAQIASVRFYASIDPDIETADPLQATYVHVRTVQRASAAWFTTLVGGGDAIVDAEAWAQSSIMACGVTPLFFCVNKGFSPTKGTQLKLKAENSYGPGNFGLLDPPGVSSGVGAKLITVNLASPQPNFCFVGDVTVRTGQVTGPVSDGVAVRFDKYPSGNSATTQLLKSFPPAPNVIKGMHLSRNPPNNASQACSASLNANAAALPRDPCIAAGTCWQGNGAWQNTTAGNDYWTKNWGKLRPANWQSMTRHDTYLWELRIQDEKGVPSPRPRTGSGASSQEPVGPTCYNFVGTGGPATDAGRRSLSVAVIDCETNILKGNSTPPLSLFRIARFFLTEPAPGGDIYGEFIEWAAPGDGGIRHLVQLVR